MNAILESLPEQELAELKPRLRSFSFEPGFQVLKAGERSEALHFLDTGVASALVGMPNGREVEVGVIGPEGALGYEPFLGEEQVSYTLQIQVTASGRFLSRDHLRDLWKDGSQLHKCLRTFVSALGAQMAQTVACDAVHAHRQRLARWLLLTEDLLQKKLQLRTDFLQRMLSTTEEDFDQAVEALIAEKLIDRKENHFEILDSDRLREEACECYRNLRDRYQDLRRAYLK